MSGTTDDVELGNMLLKDSGPELEDSAVASCTRDESFYLADGNIVLVVHDVLFKVHQVVLARHSEVFQGMLELPTPPECTSAEAFDGACQPTVLPLTRGVHYACRLDIIVSLFIRMTCPGLAYVHHVVDLPTPLACIARV